ncbi:MULTISPECIES: FixH family protein [Rhodobacterales]|jgi:nitrogen fixation protein FixH|uniref:FixH family protein n=1 Tax=Rhodobacterales TaxID=204455 RepID=UPI00237F5A53|nr:FixH family protein [Phaeobacter gallaeciensis]MDE4097398.1 FixH family protein [Phaeobacter gallaeciensis]MDE4106088.1 FixH family protein [Phaeobacter gallaeciensis]MDE4110662.1 FixH family protein [Phaeobacter gallaeciensis]MDE4115133.1 FixH family protein [Phaeobacter gallaeciensis]MDE4119602.1 FixH family protein [Phaeobacter gallaeciensis]
MSADKPQREFTGRHALMVFGGAFTVIIGVNIALAVNAVKTFPGLEVKNSYTASQEFDARRTAQEALGWSVYASAQDGQVKLEITDRDGNPVEVAKLTATLGRATHVKDDQNPDFQFNGQAYVAPAKLGAGNWNIRMVARAQNGTEFTQRVILHVAKG